MPDARLTLTERELGVLAEALRGSLAGELVAPESIEPARELIAGDELVRALAARESRNGHAALTREEVALELDAKPPGTSVRALLHDLVCEGMLLATGQGPPGGTGSPRRAAAAPARSSRLALRQARWA